MFCVWKTICTKVMNSSFILASKLIMARNVYSDVLKRHLDHHNQNSNNKRTMVACTSCHERKLKCDDTSPCRSCIRTSTECSRLTEGWGRRAKANSFNVNRTIVRTDPTNDNHSIQKSDSSQPWFQFGNPTSPVPLYSNSALDLLFSTEVTPNGVLPWSQHPIEGRSLTDLFPMPLSDNTSNPMHTFNDPLKPWIDPTRYDGESSDKTMSTIASLSPLSSSSSPEQGHLSELCKTLSQDSVRMIKLLEVYFTEIHPSWPILHAPTFNPQNASPILLGSMLVLAKWLDSDASHEKLASVVFETILAARMVIYLFRCFYRLN